MDLWIWIVIVVAVAALMSAYHVAVVVRVERNTKARIEAARELGRQEGFAAAREVMRRHWARVKAEIDQEGNDGR